MTNRALSEFRKRLATADSARSGATHASIGGGRHGRVDVDDPYLYETLATPWEFLMHPQSRGPFRWSVHHVTTPSFVIYEEGVTAEIRMSGRSPAGMLAFLVPSTTAPRSTLWKQPLRRETISATVESAIDVTFGRGQSHYMVLLDRAFFRRSLPEPDATEMERWARARVLPASARGLQSLATWIKDTLAEAERHPDALECLAAVEALGEELVQKLREVLLPPSPPRGPISPRSRVVEWTLEFVASHDVESWTVPELCRAIGVSQRTFEYAFRETFSATPHSFLRQRRLHAARHQLLAANPKTTSVTRIAGDLGFWHVSRFAADYRAAFGERPSDSLARTPRDVRTSRDVRAPFVAG